MGRVYEGWIFSSSFLKKFFDGVEGGGRGSIEGEKTTGPCMTIWGVSYRVGSDKWPLWGATTRSVELLKLCCWMGESTNKESKSKDKDAFVKKMAAATTLITRHWNLEFRKLVSQLEIAFPTLGLPAEMKSLLKELRKCGAMGMRSFVVKIKVQSLEGRSFRK